MRPGSAGWTADKPRRGCGSCSQNPGEPAVRATCQTVREGPPHAYRRAWKRRSQDTGMCCPGWHATNLSCARLRRVSQGAAIRCNCFQRMLWLPSCGCSHALLGGLVAATVRSCGTPLLLPWMCQMLRRRSSSWNNSPRFPAGSKWAPMNLVRPIQRVVRAIPTKTTSSNLHAHNQTHSPDHVTPQTKLQFNRLTLSWGKKEKETNDKLCRCLVPTTTIHSDTTHHP